MRHQVWFWRPARGASLVEFALVLPLLSLLVIGGSCLFVRNLYRAALDTAAEQAAWAAARSGGDVGAVRDAVQRAFPFAPVEDLSVLATSTGYHAEVVVTVDYRGDTIASLPFFNAPLAEAQASATNQQERAFTLRLDADTHPSTTVLQRPAPAEASPDGPAAWPSGPAVSPGGP
jgi:Flp pilus assembly protein TadG